MLLESNDRVSEFITVSGLHRHRYSRDLAAKRYLVNDGKLVAIQKRPAALLASPLWSHRGRLRMLVEAFVPKASGQHETVQEFIVRRFGKDLYEKAMEPYIAGPLASDPARACARSVLPRLVAMEQRFGSVTAGVMSHRLRGRRVACRARSVSFAGGMQTMTDHLASDPGVGFRSDVRVVDIYRDKNVWKILGETAGREISVHARHVVLSTPAREAARLVSALDSELEKLLSGIEYAPLAVIHLGFARDRVQHALDGAGFLVPGREKMLVNGVLWMSSLMPDCAPAGHHLMTAYIGGARHPEAVQWTDDRSCDTVLTTLDKLLGIQGKPVYSRVVRHAAALPQYVGAYHARTQAIAERCSRQPALHLSANYIGGVAIRDRIEQAYQCAATIAAQLQLGDLRAGCARSGTVRPGSDREQLAGSAPLERAGRLGA